MGEVVTPKVTWLEDVVIPEWAEYQGDRWTNVPGGKAVWVSTANGIDFGRVFAYDPQDSPILRILASNYTSIERRKTTRRERFLYWVQRRRRALALLVDPTIEDDLESDLW